MRSAIHAASGYANRLSELMLVPLAAALAGVLIVSVFSRYVFQLPIVQAIEITRIVFVWGCLLGAAVAVKRHAHVRMLAFVNMMPSFVRALTPLFVHGAFLVLAAMMVWVGGQLALRMMNTTFPTLGVSQAWMYFALPTAGMLIALHALNDLLKWDLAALNIREEDMLQ